MIKSFEGVTSLLKTKYVEIRRTCAAPTEIMFCALLGELLEFIDIFSMYTSSATDSHFQV